MIYRYSGRSGVQLPVLSLGLWHNFGSVDDFSVATQMVVKAFDAGICHFDLANNYGPVPGSAEENFGRILRNNLASHRDEMFVSSKAGHDMWPGVYGGNSSRKNLIASCDQSLKRTGLEYFDIFYSHRYDGVTPIEETMQALIDLVRQGKALYVGISARVATEVLRHPEGGACALSAESVPLFHVRPQGQDEQLPDSRRQRQWHHLLFTPCAGLADGEVQQWHSRRQPCLQEHGILAAEPSDARTCGGCEETRRHCPRTRTEHRPDGTRLGACRRTCHLVHHRHLIGSTIGKQPCDPQSSHLQRGRDGTHQQHHQHPLTLVLTMKKFTVLLCLLLTLYGCSDDTTSTFSNREHVYCAFDVLRADVLFNVMGNYGQFASIRKRAMEGKTQIELVSSTGLKGYYPVDQLSNNFGLGLGGLIVGTSNFGEALCYDLACPICDRSDRRLTLTADGHAKCAKCGVSYDLNNYGVIYQVPENAQLSTRRGLYRYRINFNGQIVNAYN